MRSRSRRGGFTLVEILTVVAIIAVLSSIALSVLFLGRRKSYETREASQLRQIYLAVNLYEGDFDHESPSSLIDLAPAYLPAEMLDCPSDARHAAPSTDWPANPWVNFRTSDGEGDSPALMKQRSRFINSYAYLKSFVSRFPSGRSYSEYRNDPKVGLITGLGLMTCSADEFKSGCNYMLNDPKIDAGQPAMNLTGAVLTVRTDGSIVTRHRPPEDTSGTLTFEQLFLFYPLKGGRSSAGS